MVKIDLSNQDLLARKLTFFLFLGESICCGYRFGYPQHMFSLRNKKIYIFHNLGALLC